MLTKENIRFILPPGAQGFYIPDREDNSIRFYLNTDFDIEGATGLPVGNSYTYADAFSDYFVSEHRVIINFCFVWERPNGFDSKELEYIPSSEETEMLIGEMEAYVRSHGDGLGCAEILAESEAGDDESSVCGIDFSASCPWKAPGMRIEDFI